MVANADLISRQNSNRGNRRRHCVIGAQRQAWLSSAPTVLARRRAAEIYAPPLIRRLCHSSASLGCLLALTLPTLLCGVP